MRLYWTLSQAETHSASFLQGLRLIRAENRFPVRLGNAVEKLQLEARVLSEILIADWEAGPDSHGSGYWGVYATVDDILENELACLLGYKCERLRLWAALVECVHRTIGEPPRDGRRWMLELKRLVTATAGREPVLLVREDPTDYGEWKMVREAPNLNLMETAISAGLIEVVDLTEIAAIDAEMERSALTLTRVQAMRERLSDFIKANYAIADFM